jgi:hypothetical protein
MRLPQWRRSGVRQPSVLLGRVGVRRLALSFLAVPALLFTACGAGEPAADGASTAATDERPPKATGSEPDASQLYEADVTVLEQGMPRAHGPELCFGGILTSLPPQCGDTPITSWDWEAVEGEESASGTTWGAYHVVGTYANGLFTVTEVGPYDPDGEAFGTNPDFTPPCPEPQGGWVDVDPSKGSERDFERGAALAKRLPDFVALWVEHVGNPTPEEIEQLPAENEAYLPKIMNVVVTGDPAAAEAAVREAWGGPLCVVQREGHTENELKAIRSDAERWLQEELGLQMTWSQEGPLGRGAAEVGVVIDPGGAGQAALERYDPGMVRLFPALRPVP